MKIKFSIAGRPFGKLNMRPIIRNGHAQAIQPDDNSNYMCRVQDSVKKALEEKGITSFGTPETSYDVIIVAHYELQKSHFVYHKKTNSIDINEEGKKKLSGLIRPTVKPDCDNISKIILDAITHLGAIWKDDSQVATLLVMKKYAEKPQVEVTIEFKEESRDEKN